MVLKLDPRLAIVWRDPFSLQFGVDPARVVLRDVTTVEERMIAALGSGISRSGLGMIASAGGGKDQDAADLLERLTPALLAPARPRPMTPPVIAIVGQGQTTQRIANTLAQSGAHVEVSLRATDEPCDLGIVVGHYVLDPDSYGFWLRRDVPHLPVIFGDETVTVGPLIEPGTTACLYCLEHHRRDAVAQWSAIASQLWGRRSSSETPLASREAAALVARIALRRLAERPEPHPVGAAATSFRLDVGTGEVVRREWMPHPDCGCIRLPDAPPAKPQLMDARAGRAPLTRAA
jgi:bacteriocin biosynthesis cyclodehydratase domain-containing protein